MTPADTAQTPPQWLVYILRCRDDSLYTGITTDLTRRFRQHSAGKASRYTRSRLPVTLTYYETQPSHGEALRRERAIKQLSRPEKLAIIGTMPEADLPPSKTGTA